METSPTVEQSPCQQDQQQDTIATSPTRILETVVTITTRVSKVTFSNMPSQFIEGLQTLLGMLKDIENSLQSQILCGRKYENFSKQEDALKVKGFI